MTEQTKQHMLAMTALAFGTLSTTFSTQAAELPGKGVSVQPIQSSIAEETFQTQLVSKALTKLGYDVQPTKEVDYNVAYTSVAAGDATFLAVNWDQLHSFRYTGAGGDNNFYRDGMFVRGRHKGI